MLHKKERRKKSKSVEQEDLAVSENLSTSQSADVNENSQLLGRHEGTASTSYSCKELTVNEEHGLCNSQVSCEGDDMEDDYELDNVSIAEYSSRFMDLYSLEETDLFLDETFKRSVKVSDYFSDTYKFIRSVNVLKRQIVFYLLDEKNVSISRSTLLL